VRHLRHCERFGPSLEPSWNQITGLNPYNEIVLSRIPCEASVTSGRGVKIEVCIAGLLFFVPRARRNIGSVSHPARRPAISHLINGPSEIIHLAGKSGFRRSDRNHSKREATVSSSLNWARPNPLCVMEPPEVNPISQARSAPFFFTGKERSVCCRMLVNFSQNHSV
jgi:hypothetical protein